ncbi:tetratricopeptide repeat protein [Hyalangium minutum]|uniref:tetratricopeptide repeat protein n=1 Tax=Hyalangium minutum TaxID=394096 RepID=UPI0004E72A9A|nr:hypothetical protein [Hyalangium minutum]
MPMRLPPEFAAALQLYEQLEYEAALEQLARVRSAAVDTEVRALTWLYEGIILANLGQTHRSREAFREGIRLQPASVLPIEVSPKVAQLFQDIRKEEHRRPSPSPSKLVALEAPQPSPSEVPSTPLVGTAPPTSSQAEDAVSKTEVLPWVPSASPPLDKITPVNPYHVVFAVGSGMAITGIALYAVLDASSPTKHGNLKFAAGVSGLWGLGLAAFGGVGSWGQQEPKPVGSLQSRRVFASAQFSF